VRDESGTLEYIGAGMDVMSSTSAAVLKRTSPGGSGRKAVAGPLEEKEALLRRCTTGSRTTCN
jgi:hypothetical protein